MMTLRHSDDGNDINDQRGQAMRKELTPFGRKVVPDVPFLGTRRDRASACDRLRYKAAGRRATS